MTMRAAGFAMVALMFSGVVAVAAAPPSPAAQARPPKERRLHVASAEASSYLVNDWNKFQENYLPLYVGDDDPHTAWSLKTEGIGEWVRVHVTPMEGATKLRMKIRNGYQKTPRLWEANSRAKELTVTLLPSKKTVDVTLADKSDWQEIAVDQPTGAFEAVELKVKSVYPGKKYDDLCISDVQLYVTATSSDNPAFEKQHLDKLVTWKKDRVAAAKMFKTKLGQSLPIAPQYFVELPSEEDGNGTTPERKACVQGPREAQTSCYMSLGLARALKVGAKGKHAGALQRAAELTKAAFTGMAAVRVSVRDKRPIPVVDGLCAPAINTCFDDPCTHALPMPMPGQIGYLNADALALLEQTGLPTFPDADAQKPAQCHRSENATFAWALRDPAPAGANAGEGRLRALLLVVCGMVEGREGSFPSSWTQLLVYDDAGHLELIADRETAATLDWVGGGDNPKLAGATITGASSYGDARVEDLTAVAGK